MQVARIVHSGVKVKFGPASELAGDITAMPGAELPEFALAVADRTATGQEIRVFLLSAAQRDELMQAMTGLVLATTMPGSL